MFLLNLHFFSSRFFLQFYFLFFFGLYFFTFFKWMEDKTLSLEKTMTELDKNLDRAEKFGKFAL